MNQLKLISYTANFVSFLLDTDVGEKINQIILFGSVSRGDFTSDSDIDIFIDVSEKLETRINKILQLFVNSRINKEWKLKGIKNEISIKVGYLNEWKLKREVISSGIILYGKYSILPENAKYIALFSIRELSRKSLADQIKIFRKLYGYKQKVNKKVYLNNGLVIENNGFKLGKGIFVVPMKNRKNIISFLNKNKIRYSIYEFWSDSF